MEQDYYQILGVPRDAPEREVKRAYYALASKMHPDKAADQESRKRNEEELALVSAAYNVLKDASKRADYDATIKGKKGGAASTSPGVSSTASPSTSSSTPPPPSQSSGSSNARTSSPPQSGPGSGTLKGTELAAKRVGIAERAFAKGMQLFNQQQYEQAIGFFDAALQNDDSKAIYHIKLALSLIRSHGSYTRAIEHAQLATEMDPYNVEYKMALGDIHEMAGATTAARKAYEDVLKWEPANTSAKNRISLLNGAANKSKSFFVGLYRKLTKKE